MTEQVSEAASMLAARRVVETKECAICGNWYAKNGKSYAKKKASPTGDPPMSLASTRKGRPTPS